MIDGGLPRAKKIGVSLELGPPKHFEVSQPEVFELNYLNSTGN